MAVPRTHQQTTLTPERWRRFNDLFAAAVDLDPAERQPFLKAACSDDPELRRRLESLLECDEQAHGFIQSAVESTLFSMHGGARPAESAPPFEGTERYQVESRLGVGGFGTVYRVFDRELGGPVALKVLHRVEPEALYRFKREFRSLADVTHPNLVLLHDMVSEDEFWFFTMELIEGSNLLAFLRSNSEETFASLRRALRQLVAGTYGLHMAGKLHLDLKPSNVLVEPGGRVVILDFGLMEEWTPASAQRFGVAGTPAYMAPEQAMGALLTPAADWYSIGVMLQQALDTAAAVPEDLRRLCVDLLNADPSLRPSGNEILERLGMDPTQVGTGEREPYVGRRRQLAAMRSAFDALSQGRPRTVCITGESGIGKTALLRRFLEELESTQSALILRSRCHPREWVPYNALDGVVDALTLYLRALDEIESNRLIGEDGEVLALLFPVFSFCVRCTTNLAVSGELRQRAFVALRSLLARVASRLPVVIAIDDLHWADEDSLRLLQELMRPASVGSLLLVATMRPEQMAPQRAFPLLGSTRPEEVDVVSLGPLSVDEAEQLARELVSRTPGAMLSAAAAIAESSGHPFVLTEMLRRAAGEPSRGLDAVVESSLGRLPAAGRDVIEILSIAGRPIEWPVVCRAIGLGSGGHSLLAALRVQRLIRVLRVGERQALELFHDRIRQLLAGRLPDLRQRDCHLRLANAMESSGRGGAEALALHFYSAGVLDKVYPYAVAAADEARRGLAFETEARFLRLAIEVCPSGERPFELRVQLADALASAGHGGDAARLYAECATEARPDEQIELQRRVVWQLLISGRIEEGIRALGDVLPRIGMALPRSRWWALMRVAWRRTQIRVRGLRFEERTGEVTDPADLLRVDTCWTVAQGLSLVDTLQAADFHGQHLLDALDLGEPYRLARALAVEAGYHAIFGNRRAKRVAAILEVASQIAERSGKPHAISLAMLVTGMSAFLAGRWDDAARTLSQAEAMLVERCPGAAWELATARLMQSVSWGFQGNLRLLAERVPEMIRNAQSRGDVYESTALQIRIAHAAHLANDDVEAARREVNEAISLWPSDRFYVQHWWAMVARVEIEHYADDADKAWAIIESQWPPLRRSLLLGAQYIRIESLFHRARCALALASKSSGGRRPAMLRAALADARAIERSHTHWGDACALTLRAGAAMLEGNVPRAIEGFRAAEVRFEQAGMKLLAAAAKWRIAELERCTGESTTAAWMREQGVRNPRRMVAMLVPGD